MILDEFKIVKGFIEQKKIESFDDYRAAKGFLNASSLKNVLQSPSHFDYWRRNPKEETDSMRVGTAVHCLLLEPDKYEKEYSVLLKSNLPCPDADMRNGENRKYKADFLLANEGKIILDELESQKIELMCSNAKKLPLVERLLKKGTYEAENSYYFNIDNTDFKGKIRVDYESLVLPLFMDIKTSKDTSVNGFRKEFGNYDNALQIGFYYDNLIKFREIDFNSIYILAVGNTAPYLSGVFHITPAELEYGRSLYQVALNRLEICESLGYFPGIEINTYDATSGKIEDFGVVDLDTYFKKDFVV